MDKFVNFFDWSRNKEITIWGSPVDVAARERRAFCLSPPPQRENELTLARQRCRRRALQVSTCNKRSVVFPGSLLACAWYCRKATHLLNYKDKGRRNTASDKIAILISRLPCTYYTIRHKNYIVQKTLYVENPAMAFLAERARM